MQCRDEGRKPGLGEHPAESATLLCKVNRLRAGADDRNTRILQGLRKAERGLPA